MIDERLATILCTPLARLQEMASKNRRNVIADEITRRANAREVERLSTLEKARLSPRPIGR